MVDYDKILYSTLYPIDKVVDTGEFSHTLAAPSAAFYNNSDTLKTDTIANPYGKKCMVRFAWSLDNINFYPPETLVEYSFIIDASALGGPSSTPINGTKGAASMGADATSLYFTSLNGYHGNVTYTFGNDVFVGIAQTFYYKWAIFEIE